MICERRRGNRTERGRDCKKWCGPLRAAKVAECDGPALSWLGVPFFNGEKA